MLVKFLKYNNSQGFAQEQDETDELSAGMVTTSGVSGVGLNAASNRIVGVSTPSDPLDAANKQYVDAVANGIDWKESVRAVSISNVALTGLSTVDGVLLVDGDRVLLTGQTLPAENGLYNASSGAWTRTADASTSITAGIATFVEEGTVYGDSTWALVTDNPITVDVTPLTFSQISGVNTVLAAAGLVKVVNSVSVELDTLAAAQTAGADGGSSGLEFDITGVTGKLRARVNATGSIQRSSSGLSILLDNTPTTLSSGAAGLKVTGLPLSFLINNVATGSSVTATALSTITSGANANGYHYHQSTSQQWTASGAISKGAGVYISGNDVVSTGTSLTVDGSRIIGVAGAAISNATSGPILSVGTVTGVLSGAVAGTPYYLSSTGLPVLYAAVPSGERVIRLGFARNATDLEVRVQDYGAKA